MHFKEHIREQKCALLYAKAKAEAPMNFGPYSRSLYGQEW